MTDCTDRIFLFSSKNRQDFFAKNPNIERILTTNIMVIIRKKKDTLLERTLEGGQDRRKKVTVACA